MNTATRLPLNVLTHSSEATFKTCPRKFFYRYRLGLVPAHDSNALRVGTAFHAGLEVLKNGGELCIAEHTVRNLYESEPAPPWHDETTYAVERETALAMVRGWAWRYRDDAVIEYLAVEHKFDLAILHPQTARQHQSFRNQGKIDGVCRLPDGRLAIVEHKTTGEDIEPGADYWRRLALDSQISRYFLAARASGFDVVTTIYDVTRKPQIKPRNITKADQALATGQASYYGHSLIARCPERETPEMYGARLLHDMMDRPERYFARMEVPRLEADLESFIAEQWQIAQQIGACERYGRYYRNTAACTSPYRCTYLDICSGYAGDPEQQIPTGFRSADVLHPELVTETETV